ncbi:MAG TPA: radical SAM protein, partial [Anaerolineales bacterium]|nr:radical SAM protein [Anaerolineales bacterium]
MAKSFRIGLISPYGNLSAIGLRYISACLRDAGWQTRMIFLPDPDEVFYKVKTPPQNYASTLLDQVVELCRGLDLVGITVMSNYFGRARALTKAIHQNLGIPVIWGGIHPTVRPEESLEWADYVCVGEGEEAMIDLVRALETGADTTNIPNIWTRSPSGEVIANPSRAIYPNLDDLPLPDYDLNEHFILFEERVVPITPALLSYHLKHNFARETKLAYMISTTRGCPYRCTFCCDTALADMFPKWRQLRRRSPEKIIGEINTIRNLIPNLEAVMFIDSTFLAVRNEFLEVFSQMYREQVGLPFFIQTTPGTVKEDKIKPLVEAGLVDVGMGMQTGSTRIRHMYERFETNEQILEAGQLLQKYKAHIPYPTYDLISDNPYETDEDKLETLKLLYELPRPHAIHFFSLTFYPGTKMYEMALKDGLIRDHEQDIYAKSYVSLAPTYYNFVLWCLHRNWPRWILW